jgi:hypothetical protein
MIYWIDKQRKAADQVMFLLNKPLAESSDVQSTDDFDPWDLFPSLYGTYDSAFEECAIAVLEEIVSKTKVRDDLASEMFREMLCTSDLCDYGSSPRVCFSTVDFEKVLPAFIEKWKAYSLIHSAGDNK